MTTHDEYLLKKEIGQLREQLNDANELLASPYYYDGDRACRYCGKLVPFGHYQECSYELYLIKWEIEEGQ